MKPDGPLLFALGATEPFGRGVAAALETEPAALEERDFEDGEHKLRPLVSVRDSDCYVLHSLYGDAEQSVNDKLCRLLFFAATLRDHGAARITLLCPYLAYARKDRRTKSRDPVTTRYVAQLIEAVGVDRVAILEPHNAAAFDNCFRIPAIYLHAREALVDALLPHVGKVDLAVVSPDTGGAKRADAVRRTLFERTGRQPTMAFLDKYRSEGVVTGNTVAGDVNGRTAVIIDDLIASGTTLGRAAHACRERGASGVYAVVTHGLFARGAEKLLQDAAIDRLLVTDSITPRMREHWDERVECVSVQPLFAGIVRALHQDRPVSDVLEP